ncbi:DUF4247 domain-containing protein [Paenibacillus sp. P96]|uniref:DUF4247 domain-containing protein n=1 Tax=Paenibacillus zeirhizosphaerae TaxID=2987519 RepID=A0ABT9FVB5_9BACL|nr:DUF4247 domain-containing protein [Paenibacillus sp. P96]MDP4098668.1 DUF4247 domain-containing protein [Paenibacillus sp. P96]
MNIRAAWQRNLKIILALCLFMSVLSGCGSPSVKDTYPLESVNGSGNATSYVYRAADKTVPEVAQELVNSRTPEQMSPESKERMFVVYADEWYHLQQDPQKPADTLIEVDTRQYVQQNYSSSFLQGYLVASLLDDLFDTMRGGSYRGYTSRDVYKPPAGQYRKPTTSEKKTVPPITVDRSGSVIRRGGTGSVGSGGSIFDRGGQSSSPSRGTINRDKSKGGIFDSPRKSYTKPKTRIGSGKIGRRGRR